jgi:DNA-binding SARP family transcriptional activator
MQLNDIRGVTPPQGLLRERLLGALMDTRRVGMVIAPAGSGKTTLLTQFAQRIADQPVAWHRAEREDRGPDVFLDRLADTIGRSLPGIDTAWADAHSAATAIAHWDGGPATVIIDDLHVLHGSGTEAVLGRLLDTLPGGVRLIAGSRVEPGPGFNLPRLWVSGHVVEVNADDLRFRSWEVEQLFREIYSEPLPPEALAALTRRTHGWAAGLKLFHLASTGKPTADRHRMVAALTVRSRMVREYLATNVVDELPEQLRTFLRDTCVLTRLSAALCDQLRGARDSARLLTELVRRQLLTHSGVDEWYRCHDVLRSYVQALLLEDVGEHEARERHRRAGTLLEGAGLLSDAAIAYCYAEAWDAAFRVLGAGGAEHGPGDLWPDALPATPHEDSWFHLIMARRSLAEGRIDDADAGFRRAERATGPALVSDIARRELRTLTSWFEPRAQAPVDWIAALQAAARGTPPDQRPAVADAAERRLVAGVAHLISGDLQSAAADLAVVADEVTGRPPLTSIAVFAGAVAALLDTDPHAAAAMEHAADHCDRQSMVWLAHLCRAAMAMLRADTVDEAIAVHEQCRHVGDHVGAALAALFAGLATVGTRAAVTRLTHAGDTFAGYGLRALQMWALAGRALALEAVDDGDAVPAQRAADAMARQIGAHRVAPVLRGFFADHEPARPGDGAVDAVAPAPAGAAPTGAPAAGGATAGSQPVTVRVLGGFTLQIDGRGPALLAMKPRARAVLHLLALHAGHPVHRDVIVEALWPDREPQGAVRAMHVSLSTIRRQLEALDGQRASALLGRQGDAYVLAAGSDVWIDVAHFERTRIAGDHAARAGDVVRAIDCYRAALATYRGELLPEAGTAEWILTRREELRTAAAEVAERLATLLLEQEDLVGAISVCERGLSIDGFRDGLWRLAVSAHERRGHHAVAERMRQSYEQVLRDLGVETVTG